MQALAAATREQHREVEALVPSSWRALTAADYGAYLGRLAGFHIPLEERLFGSHAWSREGLPDAEERRRAHLLRDDLRALGVDERRLPICVALPDVSSWDRAIGSLYVLEGSTLGGQVLARELESGGTRPTSFVRGAGEETARRWKAFCAFAEAQAARHPALLTAAPQAAQDTFSALRDWLVAPPLSP